MLIAALFTIVKTRKQPKFPLTDEWISKMCNIQATGWISIHTMEFTLKRKEGLPWWSSGKESVLQCRGHRFDPWSGN